MFRRALLVTVCLLTLVLGLSSSCAEPASQIPDEVWLRGMGATRQPGGFWTVIAPETQAMLERVTSGDLGIPQRAHAAFYFKLEVHADSGRLQPVLVILAFGREAAGVYAVSVGLDGVRYDMAAAAEPLSAGGVRGETALAAPGEHTLDIIRSLITAESVTLRLYGQNVTDFAIDPSLPVKYTGVGQPDWQNMPRASMDSLSSMLGILTEAGLEHYPLWDQSAAVWETKHGFVPNVRVVTEKTAKDAMAMLMPGDKGADVKRLQELLAGRHLYYGPVNGTYNELTRKAVKRLQDIYGLPATGCADGGILSLVENGMPPQTESAADKPPAPVPAGTAEWGRAYTVGDTLILSADQCRYTRLILPSRTEDSAQGIRPLNSDHLLLAVDGSITGISPSILDLYWDITAELLVKGIYVYPCSVKRERDNGTRFDTQLLPLESARMIISAEIPAVVAKSGADVALVIKLNDDVLTYQLR